MASYRETVKMALVHLDSTQQSEDIGDAIRATLAGTDEDIAAMEADEAMTRRALDLLGSRRNDVYEAALAALREDTQAWWADALARDPAKCRRVRSFPLPMRQPASLPRRRGAAVVRNRKKELANRPLICEQAFGEALDPDKLEQLGRYEVHLDRKLERMLTMLLRLKELRRAPLVEG